MESIDRPVRVAPIVQGILLLNAGHAGAKGCQRDGRQLQDLSSAFHYIALFPNYVAGIVLKRNSQLMSLFIGELRARIRLTVVERSEEDPTPGYGSYLWLEWMFIGFRKIVHTLFPC